jgi:lipoprotein-anchoring transpeptidase ErfK/SrfK
MKRFLLVLMIVLLHWLISAEPALAAPDANAALDPGVLCLPGAYASAPGDCNPVGPSAYLASMAEKGLVFPLLPTPGLRPDPILTQVQVRYGFVNKPNAPVYASPEDAANGRKRNAIARIDSSFSYISYTEEALVDGKRTYMIGGGQWMSAADIVRIGAVPLFQGLTFDQTPLRPFGWILAYLSPGPVETKRTPGYQTQDYTGRQLNNHEIVWVYAEQKVGEETWYMVGPDEWVHEFMVARVLPNPKPPQGVAQDAAQNAAQNAAQEAGRERWIEVNLHEQTIAVYDQRRLVFATLIASGLDPFWTRPGLFQVYDKLETTPMRGAFEADRSDAYYLEDVPWTMYFDQARALHGAYWRANLGFPQSHGCVNLSVGDSRWLFEWAEVGDYVYVWDPSGKTPSDPALYGAGGA